MAMDGKELVEKLAKLSQVQSIKDIPQLTHALFPGTHCPLMGAAMAVGGIKDSLIEYSGCRYHVTLAINMDRIELETYRFNSFVHY